MLTFRHKIVQLETHFPLSNTEICIIWREDLYFIPYHFSQCHSFVFPSLSLIQYSVLVIILFYISLLFHSITLFYYFPNNSILFCLITFCAICIIFYFTVFQFSLLFSSSRFSFLSLQYPIILLYCICCIYSISLLSILLCFFYCVS